MALPEAESPATECPAAPVVEVGLPSTRRLTDRQRSILDWISDYSNTRGFPPTLREIGAAFGIKSTNGVHEHVRALEQKGYIRRSGVQARAIVVVGKVNVGTESQTASALEFLRDDNRALRELLSRLVDACADAPALTAKMAVVIGDVRAVLRTGVPR